MTLGGDDSSTLDQESMLLQPVIILYLSSCAVASFVLKTWQAVATPGRSSPATQPRQLHSCWHRLLLLMSMGAFLNFARAANFSQFCTSNTGGASANVHVACASCASENGIRAVFEH